MKRSTIAVTGGAIVQALLFLAVSVAAAFEAKDPGPTGIAFAFKVVWFIALQLSMPGFLLFVGEHGHSSLLVRILAIVVDIAIYSLIIAFILSLWSTWKASSAKSIRHN